MCFSESASFTAAAVLTVQGLAAIYLVRKYPAYFLLAAIPLFFAIQQFSEGIIWNYFNHGYKIEGPALTAAHVFLTFAYLVWPIAIPLSLFLIETDVIRKRLLGFFLLGGVIWGLYLLSLTSGMQLTVTNSGKGILYGANYFSAVHYEILKGIYLGLLVIPIFISSLRYIWVFGFATLVSALIAHYFYQTTFTSVWCFFGALLSLMIYQILKVNLKQYVRQ